MLARYVEEMCAPIFTTEMGVRASFAACVVFGVLALATWVDTIILWHKDFNYVSPKVTVIDTESSTMLTAIKQIPNAHLFGDNIANEGFVPITSLQLRLVGVFSSSKVNQSHAIISEGDAPGKVYAVGDSLPSGIQVYAIHDDGVIFNSGGHLEKLPLVRSRLHFEGMPRSLWSQNEN